MGYEDTKFITNEEGNLLSNRLKKILNSTQYFDVLVGYFRLSGFKQIYENMVEVEKIRILIGINTEKSVLDILNKENEKKATNRQIIKNATDNLVIEMENSEDNKNTEESVKLFTQLVKDGKIELRGYKDRNIHAKLYICKFFEDDRDSGRVITGSSNLSYSGIQGNIEFNVELRDGPDLRYATDKFNQLWEESVDITEEFVETVDTKTWLREDLTPYEIYLKTIYEYYKDILDESDEKLLPEELKEYKYQTEAVTLAYGKLKEYGGVFISDVVGLGKTYITSMLLKKINERVLIVCPPNLIHNWEEVTDKFGINCVIESTGKIEDLERRNLDHITTIVLDEAHKYRNSETNEYSVIHRMCKNKNVILVTATPRNNYNTDIESLLYLFQDRYDSNIINNTKNLERYFKDLDAKIKGLDKRSQEYKAMNRYISAQIRDDILSKVMIRRTRTDIINIYGDDIENAGLKFPLVETPERLTYKLEGNSKAVYTETIEIFSKMEFDVYRPLNYYTGTDYESRKVSERNILGFMRTMFIKRLESSFSAFRNTLDKIIYTHERFISLYDEGYISLMSKKDLDKLIKETGDDMDISKLSESHQDIKSIIEFRHGLIVNVTNDLNRLLSIKRLWDTVETDYKWENFIKHIDNSERLRENKLIIFTEYKDTGDYLAGKLRERGKNVINYNGGSSSSERNIVRANFDPNFKNIRNIPTDVDILVTTDVLAEGINLNKTNIIINYDIPWNPTKVIQRVGRINRVGTEFDKLYVYNLFPTDSVEEDTNMMGNIINKLQSFHDILGEDSKYLSEEEEVSSKELYGTRNQGVIDMIDGVVVMEDSDEVSGVSKLAQDSRYIRELKGIKENDAELFNKISKIPKKSRTSKKSDKVHENSLVTFIKEGKSKRFYLYSDKESEEIDSDKALMLIYSSANTPKGSINEEYFDMLRGNKLKHIESSREKTAQKNSRSNQVKGLVETLDTIKRDPKINVKDRTSINMVRDLAMKGSLSLEIVNQLRGIVKVKDEKYDAVNEIMKLIPSSYMEYIKETEKDNKEDYEVVLSMYLER